MKTAPAFLVALTVFTSLFLESSTAPNPMLGGIFSIADKLVLNAGKAVGGVINGAANTAGGLFLVTEKLVEGVLSDVGKLLKDVTSLIGGLLGTVNNIKSEHGEKLKKALADAENTFEEVIELCKNIINTPAEGANNTVKESYGLLKKAEKKLNALLALVNDILEKISEKAGDNTSVVVNKVKADLSKVTEVLKNLLNKVAMDVKSKTTKVVDDSDQWLKELITSSNDALEKCTQTVRNAMDKATGEYKDGITEVYKWLTKEFQPLVANTHSKLEQVAQGTAEEHNAMASELGQLVERVENIIKNFTNIPEILKAVLNEKILIEILGNARKVRENYSQAKRY